MVSITTDPGSDFALASTDEARAADFSVVGHTTHLASAIHIIREGEIRPGPVYGYSHLNDKRIEVVWLNPNEWPLGNRYGTIRFALDFEKLIENREAYWVERAEYRLPTFRFLITDRDRSADFRRRSECTEHFPWLLADGAHYYHERACVEFMFEHPIPLASGTVSFVPHSNRHCRSHSESPSDCEELGIGMEHAAARFLAAIVSDDVPAAQLGKLKFATTSDLVKGWVWLTQAPTKFAGAYAGSVKEASEQAIALARTILSLYVTNHLDDCVRLIKLFNSDIAWRRVTSSLLVPKLAPHITSLPITDDEIWHAIIGH